MKPQCALTEDCLDIEAEKLCCGRQPEGVTLFWALMAASCSRSRTAVERDGMFAAKCRAVLPLMSTRLGSA